MCFSLLSRLNSKTPEFPDREKECTPWIGELKKMNKTVLKNGSLYAFCMNVPASEALVKIKSPGKETGYFGKAVK
jgi:hypothetical protein